MVNRLPAGFQGRSRIIGTGLLVASAVALLAAPSLMPAGYSWLRHTTSESAAQGVPGAWLARLGFLTFGLTVIWLSSLLRAKWPSPIWWAHLAFGVLMTATAAFSTRPWWPEAVYDPVEDSLHSFTATAMGFAFAAGAVLRLLRRGRDRWGLATDVLAALAAVALPLAMSALTEWTGALQRVMFAVAYAWYGLELWRPSEP